MDKDKIEEARRTAELIAINTADILKVTAIYMKKGLAFEIHDGICVKVVPMEPVEEESCLQ